MTSDYAAGNIKVINAVLVHFITVKERDHHAVAVREGQKKKKKKTYKDGNKSHSDKFAD